MSQKIAIVTGATKGIGYAIAKQLECDGYRVMGTYVREYEASFIESLETSCFQLKRVDARDKTACDAFVASVMSEFGRVDVLVNNAGIVKDQLMLRMNEDDFRTVLDVNLVGVFNMTQALTKPLMKQRFGSIVNITSVIGLIGNVGQANYAASKAGLIGFSKSIAKEFAPRGIRVNCVAPGFIATDMTDTLDEKTVNAITQNIAMKTLGTSQDVADAVSFLASDKAKYITGQTLNVCGGLVM